GLAKLIESTDAEADTGPTASMDGPTIADGPAATHEPTPGPHSMPSTGAVVGTPLYMAPEIWRKQPATRLSDVYSLGVLFYELAAGRPPHAGKSLAELCAAVTSAPPPPLGEVVENIDAGFAAIVDRCVALDPGRRFES